MKTKIKRHSRAVISVILAISMLVSCMMVGLIATDAASDNSEKTGSQNWGSTLEGKDCKIHGNFYQDGSYSNNWQWTNMYVSNWNEASVTYLCIANKNYYFQVNVSGTNFSPTSDNDTKITTVYDSPDNDANGAFYITTNNATSGFVKVVIRLWANYSGNNRIEVTQTSLTAAPNAFGQPQGQASWSTSNTTPLQYDDTSARYYFDADNVGQVTFRFWLFDTHHFSPQRASGDNVTISNDSSNRTPCWEVNSSSQNVAFTVDSTNKKIRIWISAHGVDTTWTNEGGVTIWYEVLEEYVVAPSYYVSGDTALTGTNWGVAPETGKMTNTSGTVYTKTFKNIPAGTYNFRITDGSTYFTSYSDYTLSGNANPTQGSSDSNNVQFTTAYANANVTITFDSTQDGNAKYPVTVTVREVAQEEESWSGPDTTGWTTSSNYKVMYVKGETQGSLAALSTVKNSTAASNATATGAQYYAEITDSAALNLFTTQYDKFLTSISSNGALNGITGDSLENDMSGAPLFNSNGTVTQSDNNLGGGYRTYYRVETATGYTTGQLTRLGILVEKKASSWKFYFYTNGTSSTPSVPSVDVYAKDGAIRYHDGYGPYHTLALKADTVLDETVTRDGVGANITVTDHPYSSDSRNSGTAPSSSNNQDYQTGTAKVGDIITVTTTISADDRDKYYVKGFVVNGKTPEIYNWNSNGVYTLNYEITGEEFGLTNGNKLEITPVFFLKDDTNTVNFSIEGFTPDVQGSSETKKWGNTMYVYPFYMNSEGNSITGRLNAFGSYPGQPLIYDGGKYYIQVPKSITYSDNGVNATATVQGVTMSNGYWDHVHREVTGWPDNSNASHRQTYDYDDFYKISNELSPDNIIFEFKYETTLNNDNQTTSSSYSDITTFKSTFTNGWEDLKDVHGRKIDIFGNVLSENEISQNPKVYVVSKGYHETNAGHYATEWEIFYPENGTSTTKIVKATADGVSDINPSALVLENSSKFEGYANADFSSYKGLYDLLNSTGTAKKHPVEITFESERLNNSGDIAYRSDGQWYHSKNNDIINANIIIEYQQADKTYIQDPFVSGTNQGTNTGAKAYFTNEENNIAGQSYYGKTATGNVYSNNKEFFTFAAEPSNDYEFVEWKRLVNGVYYDISGNSSPKTSIDTYVARFRPVKSGNLTVSHTLLQDDTYKGSGTTEVQLEVFASNDTSAAATYTTGFKTNNAQLTSKYIKANSSNYVRVTLRTTPTGEDTFHDFGYTSSAAQATFFPAGNQTTSGVVTTKTIVFPISALFETVDGERNQVVSVLSYNSRLNKVTFAYNITYYFNGRLYGNGANSQWYVVKGNFTSTEVNNYLTKDGSGNYYIASNFISSKKPYERDFMRDITWDFGTASTTAATKTTSDNVITLSLDVREANTTSDSTRTAIFKLPYYYNPKNNYLKNDYVPVAYREQRTNAQGGTYYVTTGYYYTDTDVVNDTSYADYQVHANDPGQTSKELVSALHDEMPVKYGDAVPTFTVVTTYGKRFTLDKPYNENDKASTYIEAVPSIWDGTNNKQLNFHYWKITNLQGQEIAKCYYSKFNFSAYENYIIEPIYDDGEVGQNITSGESEQLGATISFLDSSRNQWNEGGKGSNKAAAAQNAGDVLFKDFAIAYKYNSKVLNTYTDEDVKVGMIVERVEELQSDSSGNKITNLSTYEDLYDSGIEAAKAEIIARQKNGSKTSGDTHLFADQKIASNCNETGYGDISDTELVDNKNRLKYYYGLYNSAGDTSYTNKNFIYRAYAYIAVRQKGASDWKNAKVEVSDPVYFNFYDIASK